MRRFVAMLAFACLVGSAPATAQTSGPVVVELYTSQGCSSCPPADKLLGELTTRDDVIPLSLHVDYWDYIGWKDEFGSPMHTARQKGYARAGGHRMVYTPQMVVGGVDHVVGFKPMKLVELIEAQKRQVAPVSLELARSGDRVEISLRPTAPIDGTVYVQLVRYMPEATVSIRRGENAGRTYTYHNVVTAMTILAEWDGVGPITLDTAITGDDRAVVIVQLAQFGAIIGAARVAGENS
ncbi:MAG: DUF1223 domain-containing protein [Pseudomonadota bacterium]